MRLFARDWELQIDTLDVKRLDFSFKVEKNLKTEPNKLELRIYNLSPDHIAQITERAQAKKTTGVTVQVSAGYADGIEMIFTGDARSIQTTHEGADRVTSIAAHDGGRAYRESRISASFAPGVSVSSVIAACARAMGIGIGNALDVSAGATVDALGGTFPSGIVLSGRASDQLGRVTRAAGLSWSVQNGVLQLMKGGAPLQTTAVRIASDTGMVGSPSVDMNASIASAKHAAKKPTQVSVKTLMIAGLYPGRKVVLDAADYRGGYQIVEAKYTGDTAGNDWNCDLRLEPY